MRKRLSVSPQRRGPFWREARSGGGTSPPCSFSTLGGRFFPAGPSLRPGEIGVVDVFCFIKEVDSSMTVHSCVDRNSKTLLFRFTGAYAIPSCMPPVARGAAAFSYLFGNILRAIVGVLCLHHPVLVNIHNGGLSKPRHALEYSAARIERFQCKVTPRCRG